jgi:hypothetical protein
MKSRLLALCAAGALIMTVAPAIVSAANPSCNPSSGPATGTVCDTGLTLTVKAGTTIWAPSTISVTAGFPGEVTASASQTVYWLSNEDGKHLTVSASSLDCALCTGTYKSIDNEDIAFNDGTNDNWLGSAYTVASSLTADGKEYIVAGPGGLQETRNSQAFTIKVAVPSVEAGDYAGTLTFSVAS